jgi:hypothetical protein
MPKGLSGLSNIRRPSVTMPGAASGTKWLGTMMPPLPNEQPSPGAV